MPVDVDRGVKASQMARRNGKQEWDPRREKKVVGKKKSYSEEVQKGAKDIFTP